MDQLDAGQLRGATFLGHVEIHDSLGSTNDRAAELARNLEIELPALVVARRQTAGRGRAGKNWWSADGALTFSLLLDTSNWELSQRDWPKLSLLTAAAICDTLRPEVPDARISVKAPNDVLIDGRKISGILIESPGGAPPARDRLIMGIGINVNNSWRQAPSCVGGVGTALSDITSRQHDLQPIVVRFLTEFERRLRTMASES